MWKASKRRVKFGDPKAVLTHHLDPWNLRQRSVAGRRVVEKDDVPALLPADGSPEFAHALQDVAVADLCALQRDTRAAEGEFQPQVGHHGGDDGAAGEPAPRVEGHPADSHDPVAGGN